MAKMKADQCKALSELGFPRPRVVNNHECLPAACLGLASAALQSIHRQMRRAKDRLEIDGLSWDGRAGSSTM